MERIITKGEIETKEIGYKLGKILKSGDLVCLIGDLGAGKTTLTKSITKGLKVDDYVTSPTFTLINEYEGKYPVYHFDVYRIGDVDEMFDLGFEEYLYSDGVIIIEWANLIEEILPNERLTIELKRTKDIDKREINFYANGMRYKEIIKELNI